MRIEQHVAKAWAKQLTSGIIKKVIADLRKMKSDEMLSGDDSGLKNVWDEVCVQVQNAQSFYWDAYEETIEGLLNEYIEPLDQDERLALWLATDEGWDYVYDHYADDNGVAAVPVLDEDIVKKLKDEMWSAAGSYTNSRITRFIDRFECE